MKKLLLLFNTLKYLKWNQIYFRLKRKIIKLKATEIYLGAKLNRQKGWNHFLLYDDKIDSQYVACFLNYSKKLNLPEDWNVEFPNKLWVYNLHYFEDLLSKNAHKKNQFHIQLLNQWIDENPEGFKNGWEPYPTSLRIVNILKAWLGGLELDEKLLNSVFIQASFLSNNLEKHLLGNHYFSNLKALLFAGLIYNNKRWLRIAEKGLVNQIPEQILEDGANFELSPMYHSLMLIDMLDMYNLSKAYEEKISSQLSSLFKKYIPKMLDFMEVMMHPDGCVSFFNDSVDGIAPSKKVVENYATKLGFEIRPIDYSKTQIINNSSSGYICAITPGNKLIFDVSNIGPDYIPSHAHADTLSFELSLGNERVFVNSGTSQYGMNKSRLNQRKTKSHNTVEIDGKDSSQVWGNFRVANRARISEKSFEINSNNRILLSGEHDGYKRAFKRCNHSRNIDFDENTLIVRDFISGRFKRATSNFYFHPELDISLKKNILLVRGSTFLMQSNLDGLRCYLSDSEYYPEFGLAESNKVLSINFIDRSVEVCFTWVLS